MKSIKNLDELFLSSLSTFQEPTSLLVNSNDLSKDIFELKKNLNYLDYEAMMMFVDSQTYLTDDILCKVDRASMQHSLEVRVPFLDHRIVDFAFRLNDSKKIYKGKTKNILRKALTQHLTPSIFERPKEGFSFPIGDWLRGPLREWSEDLLQSQQFRSVHYIQHDQLDKIWEQHQKGEVNHQKGLWTILMFASWYSHYFSQISTNKRA